jgi:hypothetical protein
MDEPSDPHSSPDGIVCFETNRRRRGEAVVFTLIVWLSVCLVVALVAGAIGIGACGLPVAAGVGVIVGAVLAVLAACRNLILSKLRFSITFRHDGVQIGRRLAKRLFAYDDVDIVYAEAGPAVRVRSGNRTAAVFLDPGALEASLALLRGFCPNATSMSGTAGVWLPETPTNPERVLAAVERHFRRRAWLGILFIAYLAYLCAVLVSGLIGWWNGNALLQIVLVDVGIRFVICYAVFLAVRLVWAPWRSARFVRRKRFSASASEDPGADGST